MVPIARRLTIRRVFDENFRVYGVRKVRRQIGREVVSGARCTVARLMRQMDLQGVVREKAAKTTTSRFCEPSVRAARHRA